MSKDKASRKARRAAERKAQKAQQKDTTSSTGSDSNKNKAIGKSPWWLGLIAVAFTALCFSNIGSMDFVNWDDDRNTYENDNVANFTFEEFGKHTKAIFTSDVIGNYNPLTILSFGISSAIHGIDKPGPWHWENLILHLICVWLVYRIAILLGLSWRGALFVALLFGIQPMRVESVTWITERKDVLFGAFFLGALALYIRNKRQPSTMKVVGITVLFALSLLSKIQAVALPLTFLAVDYYLDKEVSFKNIISKTHYFLMSLATGIIGIMFLRGEGSLQTGEETFNLFERLFIGAFSFIVYLVKSVIPYRMSPLYPYPDSIQWYMYASIIIAPIMLYIMYRWYKKGQKAYLFGMLVFIFNVIFMLQIVGAGQGFLADRFTYIPYLGLFFIFGYLLDQWLKKAPEKGNILMGCVAGIAIVYGFMTYQQNKIWQNSGTLWTHVIQYYKRSTLPFGNRANYYRDNKQYDLALQDYATNLGLKAKQPKALNSRGRLYFNLGGQENLLKAREDYSKAIEYGKELPQNAENKESLGEYYINLGATLARLGNVQGAIDEINKGLELRPHHESGYLNRSVLYNQQGKFQEALNDIETYFKYNPYNADLWYESARLKRQLQRVPEAIGDYDQAIKLNPGKALFFYERSRTHATLGNTPQAQADLRRAIEMGYDKVDPRYKQSIGI